MCADQAVVASARPRLVGVFGTGRNGSTLLLRLLDGIANGYVHPVECNFLSAMNDLAWRPTVRRSVIQNSISHPLRRLDREIPMRRLMRFYSGHVREIERDHVPLVGPIAFGSPPLDAIRKREHMSPAEFVPQFLESFARWLQPGLKAEAIVFKSIETPYIADYERLFPDMGFIHIVRDPLAVWASSKRSLEGKKLPQWYQGSDNLRTNIVRRWVPHVAAILARRDSPRHVIVRYEDLVASPGEVVRGACERLGLVPPEEPDTQTLLGGRHPKEMPASASQPGVPTPRRAVSDLHEKYRFEDVVTERERDLILYTTYDLARGLGYFANLSRPDPTSLWRAWKSVDKWDFRHAAGLRSWCAGFVSLIARRVYVWRCCRGQAGRPA